jgi:oxygen-independent coproporphyrinogen-3 oxidase
MDIVKETMMMGLRLTEEGINTEEFEERFSLKIDDVYSAQIRKLMALELIEYKSVNQSKVLRLTKRGRMVGNQVFIEFI